MTVETEYGYRLILPRGVDKMKGTRVDEWVDKKENEK
jgi:hypothetical protein